MERARARARRGSASDAPTCRTEMSQFTQPFLEANQARHSSRRRLPRATSASYLGLGIWMTIFGWWQLGSSVTHDLLHCTLERGQGRGLWLLHLGCQGKASKHGKPTRRPQRVASHPHCTALSFTRPTALAKAGFGEDPHAHTRHHTQHGHNHPTCLGHCLVVVALRLELVHPLLFGVSLGQHNQAEDAILHDESISIPDLVHARFGILVRLIHHMTQGQLSPELEQSLTPRACVHHQVAIVVLPRLIPR